MRNYTSTNVCLRPDQIEDLRAFAERTGTPWSVLIRYAVDKALGQPWPPRDLKRDRDE